MNHLRLFFRDYIGILIHQTDLTFTNYVKKKLEPFNLAPEQNLIMMLLWEKDGLTQNEIAEALTKDKTNIARMLSNLEGKGFIRRICDEKDRRSLKVYLTDEGKELGNHVIPIAEEFHDIICEGISDEELELMRKILLKMCSNAQ